MQLEEAAQAKSSRVQQAKAEDVTPPLSVLESNLIAMYEPSLANCAEVSTGAGSGELACSTVNMSTPEVNSTLNCAEVSPERVTLYVYVPAGSDWRVEVSVTAFEEVDAPDVTCCAAMVKVDGKNGAGDTVFPALSTRDSITFMSDAGLKGRITDTKSRTSEASVTEDAAARTSIVLQQSVVTVMALDSTDCRLVKVPAED